MTIRLVTRNKQLAKFVRQHLLGEAVGGLSHETPEWPNRPMAADYVITQRNLSARQEHYAATLGALLVVLPEAMPWLIMRAAEAHAQGKDVVIVGAEYAAPQPLPKRKRQLQLPGRHGS